jgi:hypothetical protein
MAGAGAVVRSSSDRSPEQCRVATLGKRVGLSPLRPSDRRLGVEHLGDRFRFARAEHRPERGRVEALEHAARDPQSAITTLELSESFFVLALAGEAHDARDRRCELLDHALEVVLTDHGMRM